MGVTINTLSVQPAFADYTESFFIALSKSEALLLCSAEIEAKYHEIMKLTGVLDFGEKGKKQCEQTELDDLGELGHGTCGQVFTMKHKSTQQIMAVKVRFLFFDFSCLLVCVFGPCKHLVCTRVCVWDILSCVLTSLVCMTDHI